MPTLSAARSEAQLVQILSEPYPEDVAAARRLKGDVIVLGAGGKMGPTLVRRIVLAVGEAGGSSTVFAASRFTDRGSRKEIEDAGAVAIGVDLLDEQALAELPDCPHVIYLAGMKFGASGRLPLTWAMNAYLPGRIAERYRAARIVALSTGNVYPHVAADSNGAGEDVAPEPVGEYAQSCLGRERIFQHFSERNGTPVCLIRLNYAVEARYGVLLDIAQKVVSGEPVSLETAYVNVIWQGDANSATFRALELCASPAEILNVTGPEILRVRDLAEGFAARFDVDLRVQGTERPTALLNDASGYHARLGRPKVTADEVVELVASWIERGGTTHGKPTKFEVRDGQF